ncbi:TetR/AcrR family transcriptional regulator [Micromonospora sp. WMMD712]|uniref:TetR/AcrR family transcriptional regulator n=1 Tax=Micromonospora sp. WMMD712 TaxID=3016096 RepID=UPI00249BA48E|nr:TetR/AcrR family transcriptional regulator [Micromonospora sp. WMMD712]WFE60869.1 helix-turn-helix domain containing protein [Micromonospora sp. WMMD712]
MTTPRRADAARNRDRVLATARAVVAAGDLSLQHNDLARRAGTGVGTVYRHFPTRRALLEALADDGFAALLDAARAASRHADPATGVEILLRALLTRQLADPAFAEVIATDPAQDADPATTARRAELGALAHAVLDDARRAGAVRADLTDDDLRHLVCGTAFALRIGDGPDERAERYLRVLLDGLRPGGQSG